MPDDLVIDGVFLYRAAITLAVLFLIVRSYWQLPALLTRHAAAQQERSVEALAVAINAKDAVTHEHVRRVSIYADGVGRLAGCSKAELLALNHGALLHDVGKIGVPDYILQKPGRLTPEEFGLMKPHTTVGARIVESAGLPEPLVAIVRSHHERWDGKGYPEGLAGEDIPLVARILSVVDCYDALREDRPYRAGMRRDDAIDLILRGSGTQYDPEIVGLFLTHLPEFEARIHARRNRECAATDAATATLAMAH